MAFLHYKTENYSRASELFEEIVKEEPGNVLAYYHGGISLYKEKAYAKAVSFFMTASEMSPTIKANGYYYAGICHLKMGDMDKAEELLKYARDHADSESLRGYAIRWLGIIDRQRKALKPYSVYVKLGYQYDSNVPLEPVDEDIYTNEDDFVTVGYFSGKYNLLNRQDYVAGVGYSHYQTWHNDLEQYDLVGSIFDLYGQYRQGPMTFSLSYLPHFYWVDSSRYLRRHQIRPEVSWKITDSLLTRFSYSYYHNNHLKDHDRDGHTNELSLSTYYSLKNRKGYLFGGIGYEDEKASHPDRYYDQWKIKLGLSHKMPWELELNISGKYYIQNYDHVDSFYLVQREDREYNGSISLSRRLYYEWLSVVGEFSYTKNSSNIGDFEYKRQMVTLSLEARF
jgi:tetratricopeptide (TPR) repeat protein